MLRDILRDTEPYQWILEEGRAEGRAEGREEGLEEGEMKGERKLLLALVQRRFPDLMPLAKVKVDAIEDSDTLEEVMFELTNAKNEEEAAWIFLRLGKSKKKN